MKLATVLTTAIILGFGFASQAADSTAPTSSEPKVKVEEKAPQKKVRKKKAEMCGECGKPESECECHHGKDKKHEEKK